MRNSWLRLCCLPHAERHESKHPPNALQRQVPTPQDQLIKKTTTHEQCKHMSSLDVLNSPLQVEINLSGISTEPSPSAFFKGPIVSTLGVISKVSVNDDSRMSGMSGSTSESRLGSHLALQMESLLESHQMTQLESQRGSHMEPWRASQLESQRGSQMEVFRGSQLESLRGLQMEAWKASQLDSQRGSQMEAQRGAQMEPWRGSQIGPSDRFLLTCKVSSRRAGATLGMETGDLASSTAPDEASACPCPCSEMQGVVFQSADGYAQHAHPELRSLSLTQIKEDGPSPQLAADDVAPSGVASNPEEAGWPAALVSEIPQEPPTPREKPNAVDAMLARVAKRNNWSDSRREMMARILSQRRSSAMHLQNSAADPLKTRERRKDRERFSLPMHSFQPGSPAPAHSESYLRDSALILGSASSSTSMNADAYGQSAASSAAPSRAHLSHRHSEPRHVSKISLTNSPLDRPGRAPRPDYVSPSTHANRGKMVRSYSLHQQSSVSLRNMAEASGRRHSKTLDCCIVTAPSQHMLSSAQHLAVPIVGSEINPDRARGPGESLSQAPTDPAARGGSETKRRITRRSTMSAPLTRPQGAGSDPSLPWQAPDSLAHAGRLGIAVQPCERGLLDEDSRLEGWPRQHQDGLERRGTGRSLRHTVSFPDRPSTAFSSNKVVPLGSGGPRDTLMLTADMGWTRPAWRENGLSEVRESGTGLLAALSSSLPCDAAGGDDGRDVGLHRVVMAPSDPSAEVEEVCAGPRCLFD